MNVIASGQRSMGNARFCPSTVMFTAALPQITDLCLGGAEKHGKDEGGLTHVYGERGPKRVLDTSCWPRVMYRKARL